MESCTILAQFGTNSYQNWNISVLREETEQRQKREETEKKRARRTKETPMELDALEAVRRLTLERDSLAEQAKRLEDSVTWHREELERTRAEWEQQENALQAPVRRERPETGTEPTEGTNGASRGCNVPSWGKIARDVIWCASLALQNEIRLADQRKDWDELRRLQKGKMTLDRIRDELSNIDAPEFVV